MGHEALGLYFSLYGTGELGREFQLSGWACGGAFAGEGCPELPLSSTLDRGRTARGKVRSSNTSS
ncbi:MAG: hypothetical protein ACREXR_08200 [Gammaproteobacteria bacterium]